jgi:MSHA pilin protein MshA
MGGDARTAKINAIYGSVRSASQMVYSASLVHNSGANAIAATGSVATQSGNVTTAYGYPDVNTTTGIGAAAGLDVSATNADQTNMTVVSNTMTFSPLGASTPASCQFTYTIATGASTAPVITPPVTTGC